MASKVNNLTAQVRTEFGKGAARRTRRDGLVPAVLYGHATDPQHLALDARAFAAVLRNDGTNAVLTLDIDGKSQLALTKSIVVHPIRRSIEHADLLVLKKGERVTVEVNIIVEGDAAPGTLVTTDSTAVEIEADALEIPENFVVSVEEAQIGTQITAADLALPSGVTLVSDGETLLVNVVEAPSEEDLEADGEGTEPISEEGDAETQEEAESSDEDSSDES
ncbi:50S ribosomal protein L25/general stress protein Ctc [Rhodococcus sp. 15-725-2-2b]|uniref:50S ribosomal protein L25/general stress protein Ctc n=1 Tax=unclassified Rhodococcus (in: high G+C Gram-positive bacteria) TaxID=192944 RepID=UPI000B9AC4E3|nr:MULTISPECIES: 50S ribosomal protein L25/general stress protein Ctc [unclassified Rhodococcus (in: high G+C Gram-positive bacteria)]OZC72605.1 50S ribosomal protein L25/general stress protein Ctc [Rhodococcus sp. 06-469-3-2]OZD48831.1 50S ribosomal protein L25/general stress protein Ctc [Rhodococcus sp. 06-1477-1A]OZE03277.1 50S ribosomal protein L25/general stress protein Ctc [Rhodococcus sp. 05-2255-3C]OZE09665.1 50S ribosomal protein L25/general stress protein Ctc [Rhodococcus sp. 05-2255-